MTSGLECIASGGEVTQARMRESDDWVQFVLDLPLVHEPGTTFAYCSPGMHLLSAVLTAATGRSVLYFDHSELFGPLGISDVYWPADAQGISHGWGDLAMEPRHMARLAELYLRGGVLG
jgi:CubicO group peptidase (beta-lactamase class C family)